VSGASAFTVAATGSVERSPSRSRASQWSSYLDFLVQSTISPNLGRVTDVTDVTLFRGIFISLSIGNIFLKTRHMCHTRHEPSHASFLRIFRNRPNSCGVQQLTGHGFRSIFGIRRARHVVRGCLPRITEPRSAHPVGRGALPAANGMPSARRGQPGEVRIACGGALSLTAFPGYSVHPGGWLEGSQAAGHGSLLRRVSAPRHKCLSPPGQGQRDIKGRIL
jgi:hypothetical protein